MLKKSFLTPVLSGVLAVTVAGSGVLYYFDKKDGDQDEKSNAKSDKRPTLSQVADNVSDTLDLAEQAIKGELDFAYTAKAELIFGDELTKEMGYDVKPFAVETSTKQKDKKTAADISLQYDSKNLVSLNTVYDNENETVYVKVPELSDAYLSATPDDLQALINDSMGYGAYDLGL